MRVRWFAAIPCGLSLTSSRLAVEIIDEERHSGSGVLQTRTSRMPQGLKGFG